jgi:hypothetical protein
MYGYSVNGGTKVLRPVLTARTNSEKMGSHASGNTKQMSEL